GWYWRMCARRAKSQLYPLTQSCGHITQKLGTRSQAALEGRPEEEEENAIIVSSIKAEDGSAWLCPLSGQDVGGAAVARSGITGPPDPGPCLQGHPSPSFLQQ
ncbi:hypothetical protein KUCAC02_007243, partial [Chaenocephalus aceratus]